MALPSIAVDELDAAPALLHVETGTDHGAVIARVDGPLTWKTARTVEAALELQLPAPRLLVDLRQISHLDAAGTGALVRVYLRCQATTTPLAFAATEATAAILDHVGLGAMAKVLTDDGAVRAWASGTSMKEPKDVLRDGRLNDPREVIS